ncbi:bifunctional diguanylate cyclase/phosphodiesterase [Paenibacillus sp. YYML68]|uniref:putative bifunctional diguanylate cyclase/phosphodiesterase n=1 Tax=Paenibacillus sp. YYML68 TaxID=2909250 RepID=UPI00248FE088|nr:GGDEF and EAL domain-containing protein [Paenibacillus sp. YYML68]
MGQRGELTSRNEFALFEAYLDPMFIIDSDGDIVRYNGAMLERMGVQQRAGFNLYTYVPETSCSELRVLLSRSLEGQTCELETSFRFDQESYTTVDMKLIPFDDYKKRYIYVVLRDKTELKRAEVLVRHVTYYDTLTNLPNRMMFQIELTRELSECQSRSGSFALVLVQVDRFRHITDSLGYNAADLLLKEAADRLRGCLKETDHLSRIGTCEFAVILKRGPGLEEVRQLIERIRSRLLLPLRIDQMETVMTASIGSSVYPEDGSDVDSLLRYASMIQSSSSDLPERVGQQERDQYTYLAQRRMMLDNDLRKALTVGELELHYQPQYDIRSNRLIGVEALLRWRHPQHGLIPPCDFIPLAEETGLIVPIGEWVLRTACIQAQQWREAGCPDLTISVNLSVKQLQATNLIGSVYGILKETGLDPSALELEITESIAMHDVQRMIRKLHELKNLGIRISMDDFGTGYSSLHYLTKFPLHKLKIDQSFVRGISADSDNAVIVQTIVSMARHLNLDVLAEGVETSEDLSYLQGLSCTSAQGYYFSKPITAEQFELLLCDQRTCVTV